MQACQRAFGKTPDVSAVAKAADGASSAPAAPSETGTTRPHPATSALQQVQPNVCYANDCKADVAEEIASSRKISNAALLAPPAEDVPPDKTAKHHAAAAHQVSSQIGQPLKPAPPVVTEAASDAAAAALSVAQAVQSADITQAVMTCRSVSDGSTMRMHDHHDPEGSDAAATAHTVPQRRPQATAIATGADQLHGVDEPVVCSAEQGRRGHLSSEAAPSQMQGAGTLKHGNTRHSPEETAVHSVSKSAEHAMDAATQQPGPSAAAQAADASDEPSGKQVELHHATSVAMSDEAPARAQLVDTSSTRQAVGQTAVGHSHSRASAQAAAQAAPPAGCNQQTQSAQNPANEEMAVGDRAKGSRPKKSKKRSFASMMKSKGTR